MITHHWVLWLALGAAWVMRILWVARRHPEKVCWQCRGKQFLHRLTPFLRIPVRGRCRACGGYGWKPRRLSRMFGW